MRLIPAGSGTIVINDRTFEDYFPQGTLQYIVKQPLVLLEAENKYDVFVNVIGGGYTGQAGAIRLGIARALLETEPDSRPALKKEGFLTRDPRAKERKKYGLKKARALRSSPRDNLWEFPTFQKDDKAPIVLVTVGAFESNSLLFENV